MKVPTVVDLEVLFSFLTAILASSGFWMYVMKRNESHDVSKRLLIGLAHVRIIELAYKYIERGTITQDEYENLFDYLYKPYKEIGGNGSAERLMAEVNKLPICSNVPPKRTKGECDETV